MQVCSGDTGHTEAVLVTYDPAAATVEALLATLAAQCDLTQLNRQGNDIGEQYRCGVYFHSDEQRAAVKQVCSCLTLVKLQRQAAGSSSSS